MTFERSLATESNRDALTGMTAAGYQQGREWLAQLEPALYRLADEVVQMEAELPHGMIAVDAVAAMPLGEYLARILGERAKLDGREPPRLVHFANGRKLLEVPRWQPLSVARAVHHTALVKHAQANRGGAKRALVVTEMVATGGALSRLGSVVREAGMTPDYAILQAPMEGGELAVAIGACPDSRVSLGEVVPDGVLNTPGPFDKQPFYTKSGEAEPQATAWAVGIDGLWFLGRDRAVRDFADEYMAARNWQVPQA